MTARTIVLFNAVFVIGAVLAWPIYQHPSFIALVVVSLLLANLIALSAQWRAWRTRTLVAVTTATFVLAGVPLAIPSSLTSPAGVLRGVLSLITGVITSWKDLLTLSLPVGSYQAVLVPAFVMFFLVPVLAFALASRANRARPVASAIVALPVLFAIAFGSSAPRSLPVVSGTWFAAPLEIALVITAFLLLLAWMRTQRGSTQPSAAQQRLAPALTITVTLLVAVLIVTPVMASSTRDVLRTQIDPTVQLERELSPLSLYRASFSDELVDTELFQVSGGEVERIRLATLTGYNGQVATVQSGDASNDRFARVPALVTSDSGADDISLVVGALRGVWMPTISNLQALSFAGDRRLALTDGFYYNGALEAGIQLSSGGLRSGDSVRLRAQPTTATDPAVSLASLTPGLTRPRIDPAFVPESLQEWLVLQRVPRSGAGLATLIERLTARGYLSHSITIDPNNPPEWMLELPNYQFEPSRAGHSTARIDELFTALRDRQRELGNAPDAELVAAVGDDEQFAVAAMLLADQLGFNARIVVGTKLQANETAVIPPCSGGSCLGGNLSAWLEVQGADGTWVTVDVTPQITNPIAPEVERLQDPQVPTRVEPQSVDSVQPPEAAPSQRDTEPDDGGDSAAAVAWLLEVLRWLGIVLLALAVILGPYVLIVLGKRLRSRRRREPSQPELATLGAWYEFVDAHVDRGARPPHRETRHEFVARLTRDDTAPDASELATLADQAVFDSQPLPREVSDRAWAIVDAQRSIFGAQPRRARLRAALSLRSLVSRARGEG